MSFSVKTPDDSPGFLLWQLTCQWQREQRQALAKLGLTHSQFVVLASLLWLTTHEETPITQRHVSEFSKIDKMSMSALVAKLQQKKFIERVDHHWDSRAYSLTLTTKGREQVLKAIPIVEGIDAQFFSRETEGLSKLFTALKQS
jgi:DNA-binding MarR family transcriptional regulator